MPRPDTPVAGLTTLADLPDDLPVFPLTGVLLLPTNFLPLHIFEPRYRHLVEDTLEGDRLIGMVQPFVPRNDNAGPPPDEAGEAGEADDPTAAQPPLYQVGCAGWIEHHQALDGGRHLLVLKGICRFRLGDELPLAAGGYRRVVPSFSEFSDDLRHQDEPPALDTQELLVQAATFAAQRGLQLESETLIELPARQLINGLAAALPFEPAEKQALLEARNLADRLAVLSSLLAMGCLPEGDEVAN